MAARRYDAKIAIENNLSETAFTVKKNQEFELRWFTPDREIDLCGHATLATAFVLFNYYKIPDETIKFSTQSGNLFVTRIKDYYYMDFPSIMPKKCRYCLNMKKRLGLRLKKPT